MIARFLLVVCAFAAGPMSAMAQTGAIGGKVTRSDTSAPLAGVAVQVTNGVVTASATTNASGDYTVGGLTPGNYFAFTDATNGFINEIYDDLQCAGQCFSFMAFDQGAAIAVTAGATAAAKNFALAPGGTIRGRVTDDAGAPLPNIFVGIYDSSGFTAGFARSDDQGEYRVPYGLMSGTFFASTSNLSGYVNRIYDNIDCVRDCSDETNGTPIAVTAPSATSGIDFSLTLGASVAGTVTGAGGVPLPGVLVYLMSSAGSTLAVTTTDPAGGYSHDGFAAGTYYLRTLNEDGYIDELYNNVPCFGACGIEGATPLVVAAGQALTGVNFALARGGRISGTVLAESTSAPISSEIQIYSSTGVQVDSAGTKSNGDWTSSVGLPPGTYFIATSNRDGYIDEIFDNVPCQGDCVAAEAVALGTPVVIAGGETVSGRNFLLRRAGAITGRVTDAATGEALRSVQIRAYGPGAAFGSAESDADGNYEIPGLPPGAYVLLTENAFARGFVPEIYDNLPCLIECGVEAARLNGARVNVSFDVRVPGIDFALTPGGGIRGTVVDAATGAPLAGVGVYVANAAVNEMTSALADVTSASGVFSLSGLPAGAYYVFTENASGYVDEAFGNIPCLGECPGVAVLGAPVAVGAGAQATGVDFALDRGGRISGTVIDEATSAPLAGIGIAVADAGGRLVQFTTTAANGVYTTPSGLAPGTYYVSARGQDGYVGEVLGGVPCPNECPGPAAVALGTPVEVAAGSTASGRNFALDRGGRVSGAVTESGSTVVVPGHTVRFYDAQGRLVTAASVANSGAYITDEGIPDGSYFAFTTARTHVNEIYEDVPCPAGCAASKAPGGTPIRVTAGVITSARNFALAPRTGVPGPPTGVRFSSHPQGVLVEWDPPSTGGIAASYRIDAGLAPGTTAVSVAAAETRQVIAGVPAGRFFLRVRGVNASGVGTASADATLVNGAGGVLPAAPRFARAWLAGSRLMMTWDDPYAGGAPTHYVIEAGTAAGLANIATIAAASRAFTYEPVPAGFYFLRVRAVNATGASAPSNEMLVVAGGAASPPAAPVNVGGVAAGSTVTLDWTAPAGTVTGYVLEAGSASGLSNLAVQPLGAVTSVSFTGIPPGTYYVRVRAVNALGRSVASDEVVVVVE